MHDEDDKTPTPEGGGKNLPADPFQELERMFGGLSGAPAAEVDGDPPTTPPQAPQGEPYDPLEALTQPSTALRSMLSEAKALAEETSGADLPQNEPPGEETPTTESTTYGPTATAPSFSNLGDLVAAIDAGTSRTASRATAQGLPSLAASLAPSELAEAGQRSGQRHIIFSAGGARYALAMGQVVEVGPVPAITPLPKVPTWLLGVSNLRGEILAVLDFRRFLGHAPHGTSERHRMLVLQTDDGLSAGLVVDRVAGAGTVEAEAVRPPAAAVLDPVHHYLVGVTEQEDRLLAILDAKKLLTSEPLRRFAAPEQDF